MIFSFYSYKGGVGRTQLAVNLASYLCYYQRKKILLIDWDLEAPGLHFYFEGFENVQNKGIVELFTSFVDKMQEVELEAKEEELPKLDESYIVKNVAKSSQHEGKIDMITAGFYDENYKLYNQKANAFNWKEFYDKLDGGNFIELLKKQLKALDYDYVFIDSRTGISDYSGIVNVQIPDVNILVVAPTNQNFAGALRIAENIKNAPYIKDGNRKPIIMPILSRIDLSIERNDWGQKFQEKFGLLIQEFCSYIRIPTFSYLRNTRLDYKRDISFGENNLFNDKQIEINVDTLAEQYKFIADCILRMNPNYKPPIDFGDSKIQNDVRLKYNTNYIFTFGSVCVGKTTILASLAKYFAQTVGIHTNPNNKIGTKILLESWISTLNAHEFPMRTPVKKIMEVDLGVSYPNNETLLLTFIDVAGEDFEKLNILHGGNGTLPKEFEIYIKASKIFLIVTDFESAKQDDYLILQFLNKLQNEYKIDIPAVALIISKWDLAGDNQDVTDFVNKNLTMTKSWLNSSSINDTRIFTFSVGAVVNDGIGNLNLRSSAIITQWIKDILSDNNSTSKKEKSIKKWFQFN